MDFPNDERTFRPSSETAVVSIRSADTRLSFIFHSIKDRSTFVEFPSITIRESAGLCSSGDEGRWRLITI